MGLSLVNFLCVTLWHMSIALGEEEQAYFGGAITAQEAARRMQDAGARGALSGRACLKRGGADG